MAGVLGAVGARRLGLAGVVRAAVWWGDSFSVVLPCGYGCCGPPWSVEGEQVRRLGGFVAGDDDQGDQYVAVGPVGEVAADERLDAVGSPVGPDAVGDAGESLDLVAVHGWPAIVNRFGAHASAKQRLTLVVTTIPKGRREPKAIWVGSGRVGVV